MTWDYWLDPDNPKPLTVEVINALETVLERSPRHPLAIHLYIHAVEASSQPGRAEGPADRLAGLVPGAGHLVHMPAHIYWRIGRYADASAANVRAAAVDETYIAACNAQGFYPAAYYPHNIHFLWAASSMEGRSTVAIEAARAEHKKFNSLRDATDVTFLDSIYYPATMLLTIADALILGEISMAEDDYAEAIGHFWTAVETQDQLPYTEPPFWYYPTRHTLGRALLTSGDAAGAEAVYRADLQQYPRNGWSLFGLIQALTAQGKDATEFQKRFDTIWAQTDVSLAASTF